MRVYISVGPRFEAQKGRSLFGGTSEIRGEVAIAIAVENGPVKRERRFVQCLKKHAPQGSVCPDPQREETRGRKGGKTGSIRRTGQATNNRLICVRLACFCLMRGRARRTRTRIRARARRKKRRRSRRKKGDGWVEANVRAKGEAKAGDGTYVRSCTGQLPGRGRGSQG